ncbi:hypothetical protein Dda_3253 [Drechslerella dactyloides]|uniref:G-protein coupled receptors family 2 profile 2 domain-containing protein n=1 Tax=Drechslerella dactyloides TaxID=74499 RepID=A0AAD6J1A5_DREDA|nr:hypothetical protein Dda_3253 [Drechslerella dactyloides]
MKYPDLLDRRDGALAAPATQWGDQVLNEVLFSVALASALGAFWVILSYVFIKELRTYRHLLILGLAISDFLMAANFMVSSGIHINGGDLALEQYKTTCTVNGFLTQVFVVQTDHWILVIAIATYIILGNLKTASHFIQTHTWIPWLPPWVFSIVVAVVCQVTLGYGYIGGWCWLTSDMMRLYVNFIPRWLIVIAIALIYARLYMIVRSARKWGAEVEIIAMEPPTDEEMAAAAADADATSVNGVPLKRDSNLNTLGRTALESPAYGSGTQFNSGEEWEYAQTEVNANAGIELEEEYRLSMEVPRRTSTMKQEENVSQVQNRPLTATQLKKIAKKMMVYPLAYAIIWACPTAIRIYQGVTGARAPLWITVIDKSCIVVQGLVDAFVYGLNERAWQGWRDRFRQMV